MRSLTSILCLLFLFLIPSLSAQALVGDVEIDGEAMKTARTNLSVAMKATFPDGATPLLGIFYNGRTSRVDISVANNEPNPIIVHFIGGAFQDIATHKPVQNLTTKAYNNQIASKSQETLPYSIQAYFPGPQHPTNYCRAWNATDFQEGQTYQTVAHNGTVTIADPPQSYFDPQAWVLYIILAAAFTAVTYYIYSTWLKAVIPKKSRPRNRDVKKREPAVVVKPSTTSDYEEWIPQHHLKKEISAKKRKGKGNDSKPTTPEPLSKRK